MRRHALASSIVAVLMMALAWMVVAFLQTTRVEEPGEGPGSAGEPSTQARGATGRVSGGAEGQAGRMKGHAGNSTGSRRTDAAAGPLGLNLPRGDEAPDGDAEEEEGDLAEEPLPEPWALTADGIRGAVDSEKEAIKHCYDQWLKLEPDIAGAVVVTFTVAASEDGAGEVTELELADSELDHPFIEGCVLNVFQDLPFEPPEDGGEVEINYPLLFDSHGGEGSPEEE